ncbi:MAG: hypothetical protein JO356_02020 [Acidobacteria bacterium]|nr:hypothetical protein [Acidobacteriota bacterium]
MASASQEQGILEALAYWRLVVHYRWQVLISTFALTLLFTLAIAKWRSQYEGTTTILVNPQQVPEKYVSPAVSADPSSRLNIITQQVLSRTRLEEVIRKFDLYKERRKSQSPEEIIEKMRDDIGIQVKQGSGPELSTFTLSYTGTDPQLVAKVANELASSFIRWNVSSRVQQVNGTQDFLSSELEVAKQNLQKQEEALREFKMKHLGETPDQETSNLQALAGLRTALEANVDAMNRLDEQRILLKHSLDPATAVSGTPNVELTDRGRLELEKREVETSIQQLRENYSVRHPDVIRATRRLAEIDTRLASLPPDPSPDEGNKTKDEASPVAVRLDLIDKELQRRASEQIQLESEIATYRQKIAAAPLREEQLVELTRNYETSKKHYQDLLDSTFNIGMAADLEQKQKGERFMVLDFAQAPQKPVKPNRALLIPISAFVALGLSILGIVVKNMLDPSVKTETDLKSLLPTGVSIIGLIPRIEVAADSQRARRFAIFSSAICLLLCVAITTVVWSIRHNP